MGIGAVNQVVYIGKLPEGVTMTITDVKLKVPDTPNCDWWPTFLGNKKLLTKNSSVSITAFPSLLHPSLIDFASPRQRARFSPTPSIPRLTTVRLARLACQRST